MTVNGHIETYGQEAIVVVVALLKEKAATQMSGFQITSRTIRKVLGAHFKRGTAGMWRLASFVMNTLVAKGILQPYTTTESCDIYTARADLCHDLRPEELMATGSY